MDVSWNFCIKRHRENILDGRVKKMKTNYHTHNELCGHAGGTIEEYVKKAIELEFDVLGMSDHLPFPGDAFGMRMKFEDLKTYADETKRLKKAYKNKLRIYLGGEAEYIPGYEKYYEQLLNKMGFDYLILGQHFYMNGMYYCANVYDDMKTTKDVMTYAKSAMQGMATGYFAYLAHPDLFFVNDFKVDRQLKKAVDYLLNESTKRNYILEWNANGLRRLTTSYPNAYFWEEVAKTNIPVIIGADCHSVDNLYDWAMEISEKKAKEMGLHVIDHLEIKK